MANFELQSYLDKESPFPVRILNLFPLMSSPFFPHNVLNAYSRTSQFTDAEMPLIHDKPLQMCIRWPKILATLVPTPHDYPTPTDYESSNYFDESNEQPNVDIPIALQKGTRSCTNHSLLSLFPLLIFFHYMKPLSLSLILILF